MHVAFGPMADTADHWDDLQFANLVAAKIRNCYTILREMGAGAPVLPFADGGNHSETTETRPDGETRTLTDIAPGFEIYRYKGEKLRGFVPTLPRLQFFEHLTEEIVAATGRGSRRPMPRRKS